MSRQCRLKPTDSGILKPFKIKGFLICRFLIPELFRNDLLFVGFKRHSDTIRDNRAISIFKSQNLMNTKQKALNMLAKGMGTSEVAKRLGVSQRTIQRWLKAEGVCNPVMDVCDQVVKEIAVKVEAVIGDELKSQALQLLRLSGKSLDCLEKILDNPDTRTADRLKACQIVGEWVGFQSRSDLLTHTLGKYNLELAITPTGDKTLQQPVKRYPLERDYEFVLDAKGQPAGIRKTLE